MKKSIFIILFIASVFTACASLQMADVSSLQLGMTKSDVNRVMGTPIRVLSTNFTQNGMQEVLEYQTYRNESYAVEFWDGRLTRYDFMHENVPPSTTVVVPPPVYPVHPTHPNHVYPSKPVRPSKPSRPGNNDRPNRPSEETRPNRPTESGRPSNKPTESSRPTYGKPNQGQSRPSNSSRPSYGNSISTKEIKVEDLQNKESEK